MEKRTNLLNEEPLSTTLIVIIIFILKKKTTEKLTKHEAKLALFPEEELLKVDR